ncbi:hypothetical protein [Termitidicoccus mucosus]
MDTAKTAHVWCFNSNDRSCLVRENRGHSTTIAEPLFRVGAPAHDADFPSNACAIETKLMQNGGGFFQIRRQKHQSTKMQTYENIRVCSLLRIKEK